MAEPDRCGRPWLWPLARCQELGRHFSRASVSPRGPWGRRAAHLHVILRGLVHDDVGVGVLLPLLCTGTRQSLPRGGPAPARAGPAGWATGVGWGGVKSQSGGGSQRGGQCSEGSSWPPGKTGSWQKVAPPSWAGRLGPWWCLGLGSAPGWGCRRLPPTCCHLTSPCPPRAPGSPDWAPVHTHRRAHGLGQGRGRGRPGVARPSRSRHLAPRPLRSGCSSSAGSILMALNY